ncbi:72 kDa type IV collagenase-like [Colias croceus]|uniref:72 kDa type IV collagenase-like n=1 Tax=Colias crocea TaxID=72248 RepID=UPI001E280779|nr:72 kDa type IV collagenase-like [Colias croceus]
MRLLLVTVLGVLCEFSHSLYISSNDKQYARYLVDFGYLSRKSLSCSNGHCNVDDSTFANSLRSFQNYAKTSATGMLDSSTKYLMSLSRCEGKDILRGRRRSKRYTTNGHWPKKHITYKITQYSSTMSKQEVDSLIFLGFSVWSEPSGITFTKKDSGRTDIEIRFGNLPAKPDNRIAFGNTKTKHQASVITLNDDIPWTQDFTRGEPNLFQTVSHEIGHVIGMGHTDVTGAMMYPIYDLGIKIFSLHEDDIQGIRDNYKDLNVVSYPGRPIYRKNSNKVRNNFNNFKESFTNTFSNTFGEDVDIEDIDLPKDWFSSGF